MSERMYFFDDVFMSIRDKLTVLTDGAVVVKALAVVKRAKSATAAKRVMVAVGRAGWRRCVMSCLHKKILEKNSDACVQHYSTTVVVL